MRRNEQDQSRGKAAREEGGEVDQPSGLFSDGHRARQRELEVHARVLREGQHRMHDPQRGAVPGLVTAL